MQRTTFPVEILIHDDASTDGTAGILHEYQHQYPDKIFPLYETQNQYSNGYQNLMDIEFNYSRARGKYIAYCEGDDYWTDPHKLEKQVAALEAHPEVDICAHRARRITGRGACGYVAPVRRDRLIPAERVILGGGSFVATGSLLCRREAYLQRTPMREILANDYSLQIQCSLRGGMYYLHDCMSVYRRSVPGSWSAQKRHRDAAFRLQRQRMLEALDACTQGRYHRIILRRIRRYHRP